MGRRREDLDHHEDRAAEWFAHAFAAKVLQPDTLSPWNELLRDLHSLSLAADATPATSRAQFRSAYRRLRNLLSREAAIVVLRAATDRYEPIKITLSERRGMEAAPSIDRARRLHLGRMRDESFGGLVLMAYRQCASIESAFDMVAEKEIDPNEYLGSPAGKWLKRDGIKAAYLRYRREAFAREFADIRLVHAILKSRQLPDNPLRLDDFPTLG